MPANAKLATTDFKTLSTTEALSESSRQSRSQLEIKPRRVSFDFNDIAEPFYYRGNPLISAMWATMSASFPAGEAEFINSVKLFESQINDSKLKQEVKNFAAQEAHHSLQHRQVNKLLDERGYNTAKVDQRFKEKMAERALKWSAERRLARTVVAEHVTAIMAHFALTHSESMSHFPDSFRRLFQWHAIEEIEHKSVAFDVYQHCVNDQALLRREFRYFSYLEFPFNVSMGTRFLLKQMGRKASWQDRKGLWRYLFGEDGLISSVKPLYMSFLDKDFHPWNLDDSVLVEEWKETLAPYFRDH